jgi:hypothetical protein
MQLRTDLRLVPLSNLRCNDHGPWRARKAEIDAEKLPGDEAAWGRHEDMVN